MDISDYLYCNETLFQFKAISIWCTISHFVYDDNQGFISGIVGQDPDQGALVSSNFKEQCNQMFNNLMTLFDEIDIKPDQVLKLTVYLTSFDDFETLNDIEQEYFSDPYPARSCIGVKFTFGCQNTNRCNCFTEMTRLFP